MSVCVFGGGRGAGGGGGPCSFLCAFSFKGDLSDFYLYEPY